MALNFLVLHASVVPCMRGQACVFSGARLKFRPSSVPSKCSLLLNYSTAPRSGFLQLDAKLSDRPSKFLRCSSVSRVLHLHEQIFGFKGQYLIKPGMAVLSPTCNPSTPEVQAGRSGM